MRRQRRIFASAIGHVFRGLISVFLWPENRETETPTDTQLQQQGSSRGTTKIHSSRLAFTTCLQRGNGNGSPTAEAHREKYMRAKLITSALAGTLKLIKK